MSLKEGNKEQWCGCPTETFPQRYPVRIIQKAYRTGNSIEQTFCVEKKIPNIKQYYENVNDMMQQVYL
jgi:hypothetical protein